MQLAMHSVAPAAENLPRAHEAHARSGEGDALPAAHAWHTPAGRGTLPAWHDTHWPLPAAATVPVGQLLHDVAPGSAKVF